VETAIEALSRDLAEAKCMNNKSVQPNKSREISNEFPEEAHNTKPSDGWHKISEATRHYTFGEVISKFKG